MHPVISAMLFFMSLSTGSENSAVPVQQDITGKWTMIKMDIKNGFYFDVSDADTSFKRFSRLMIQNRSAYLTSAQLKALGKADSLAIKTDFDKAYGQFRQLFIEFKKDKTYLTNQNGSGDITRVVKGIYHFDSDKKKLILDETERGTREMAYGFEGDLLILRPPEPENQPSSIVFKKAEQDSIK